MQEKDALRSALPNLARTTLGIALILLTITRVATAQQLSIRGSDTLIYLGQRFAAMYSRTSPETQIAVQGGGRDQSINALRAGQVAIAQFEGESPVTNSQEFLSFPVGVQALIVYVNESNPVRELTVAQLRSIFMGEITNWKAVGGPDANILLYAGESTTGNLAFFQDSILHGDDPYPFVGKSNTKDLLEEIASNPGAIGYGSLGHNEGTRALAIKYGRASLAVAPTEQAIRSRLYPITRYVSWAVRRQRNQNLDALCDWMLSSEGQVVVEAAGFEPLLPTERTSVLATLRRSASLLR